MFRYFKYLSTLNQISRVFGLFKLCIKDLNESVVDKNHLIPFYYLSLESNTAKVDLDDLDSCDKDYYYQNCLIDLWLKLFSKNISEKYLLCKCILDIIPLNRDLIKLLANYSIKLNGPKSTLQFVFNHLNVNSIDCDYLWIL